MGINRGVNINNVVEECILLLFGVAPMFLVPKTNG